MATLNFPASPTRNQIYQVNDRSWVYDGTTWLGGAWYPPVPYLKQSGAGGVLPSMNVAAGDSIFILTAGGDNCTAISDNSGNTYTQLANQGNSVNSWCRWWYKLNAPANSNLLASCTFSNAQGGNYNCIHIFPNITAYDNANPGANQGPTGSPVSTGSFNTTAAGLVLIYNACGSIQADSLITPASGPVYVTPLPSRPTIYDNWSIWYWITGGPLTSQVITFQGLNTGHLINAACFK